MKQNNKSEIDNEMYPKCKCGHNKIRHHPILNKRTWCLDCECIEFNEEKK